MIILIVFCDTAGIYPSKAMLSCTWAFPLSVETALLVFYGSRDDLVQCYETWNTYLTIGIHMRYIFHTW